MSKKGISLMQAPAAVFLIIIIGVVAVVGVSINTSIAEGEFTPVTITNETITGWANNTYEALVFRNIISVTEVLNSTLVINAGNYTLLSNSTAASVWMHFNGTSDGVNADNFQTGDYNISYTYNRETDAYWETTNATAGIQQITNNLDLLGLIVIMGIIITVLIASFGGLIGGRASGGL